MHNFREIKVFIIIYRCHVLHVLTGIIVEICWGQTLIANILYKTTCTIYFFFAVTKKNIHLKELWMQNLHLEQTKLSAMHVYSCNFLFVFKVVYMYIYPLLTLLTKAFSWSLTQFCANNFSCWSDAIQSFSLIFLCNS